MTETIQLGEIAIAAPSTTPHTDRENRRERFMEHLRSGPIEIAATQAYLQIAKHTLHARIRPG